MLLLRWLIWPKGCVNISNHNNYCQSKLYMPINGDTVYTQMLSCPISKTDFSFQAELLTHLTSVPLICATLVRVHQPLSYAHTAGRVCTKSGQRGSRGLEVITLFHLIFFSLSCDCYGLWENKRVIPKPRRWPHNSKSRLWPRPWAMISHAGPPDTLGSCFHFALKYRDLLLQLHFRYFWSQVFVHNKQRKSQGCWRIGQYVSSICLFLQSRALWFLLSRMALFHKTF